jgi:hypothetical protein
MAEMAKRWYYVTGGQRYGPVSDVELKQLADSGQIAPTDLVWKPGMAEWVRANRIKGLFAPSTANSPPSHPPAVPPPLPAEPLPPDLSAVPPLPLIAGMHPQRFGILVAAVLGMLATFLPWIEIDLDGSSIFSGHIPVEEMSVRGWITLALFVPAVILVLRGARVTPLLGARRLGAVIPAVLATLIGAEKFLRIPPLFCVAGIGLYLLVLSGMGLAVVAWLLARPATEDV